MGLRHGVWVGVIAILHTFNGRLEINSHVHTMVTGGGLHGSPDTWAPRVYYDRDRLKAVIGLLRAALRVGQLRTQLTADQTGDPLTHLEQCWWSIKIQWFEDKWHFLQYAGRYVRRPPIAQRRITWIGRRTVKLWYRDKSFVAALRYSALWRNSLTAGPITFRNAISMLFGALGCLLLARAAKHRQLSLPFWGRSVSHSPGLAVGRTP